MAAELPLCISGLERRRLEAICGYCMGATSEPAVCVALHGNSAGAVVEGGRSISGRSEAGGGVCAKKTRHGSLDHAVGEPDRRERLWSEGSTDEDVLGEHVSEGHESGGWGAVCKHREVI